MSQNFQTKIFSNLSCRCGGLAVRTGLRGGACVDVNDEVKAALQTLTNALGGTATAATTPTTPPDTVTTSS